jgi:hypothetical protein
MHLAFYSAWDFGGGGSVRAGGGGAGAGGDGAHRRERGLARPLKEQLAARLEGQFKSPLDIKKEHEAQNWSVKAMIPDDGEVRGRGALVGPAAVRDRDAAARDAPLHRTIVV